MNDREQFELLAAKDWDAHDLPNFGLNSLGDYVDDEMFSAFAWFKKGLAARATPAANNLISLDAALACVPGGTICDPQQVADAIRAVPIVCATPAQPAPEKHPLFYRKLADLQQRGYQVFGHILHKNGEYALFDDSCRWLTQPQYWRLMHEQDGSLFATPSPASDVSAPSPSSVGAAIRALPLPEPFYDAEDFCGYNDIQVRKLLSEAAALAEQVQGQQWLPIESAPRDGTEVLCFHSGSMQNARYFEWKCGGTSEKVWGKPDGWHWSERHPPTHWMPLPHPPISGGV